MDFQRILTAFPRLKQNELLKNHCTFRVGGPADLFFEWFKKDDLPALLQFAQRDGIPYKVIGKGTNTLFTDKGFRGLIIKNMTNGLQIIGNDVIADSGVLLGQVIKAAVERGLTGLEPLYGVPGSIGAAVWGNAGVPKAQTGNFLKRLTVYNPHTGAVGPVPREVVEIEYRHTSLQDSDDIIMDVTLGLSKGSTETSKEHMKEVDEIRRGKQPTGYTAGSFFKNPSLEQPAGWLIDQVGLKGKQIGGAQISPKHANFFMNTGTATAADILALRDLAVEEVQKKFGITLEMEVKIVGER
ncbi:UDP-N-acetylmuramate dehydrogenase [Candidatus Gracilibacteria bacterium]|nr:UDP-N-acetylmuramate dehydrogenase [Candidatus Gracilibacteria bacterium]